MPSKTLYLVFILSWLSLSLSSAESEPKICFGTTSGLSVGEDRLDHYVKMYKKYRNCTIVKGNLEITGLQSSKLEISFLQGIEEVTGYVIIALNYLPYLPLQNLKIIRGRELYKGKYALYVKLNVNQQHKSKGLKALRLSSLTEIVHGSVHINNNPQLCFADTIHWDDILNPVQQKIGNWTYEVSDNKDSALCARCNESCVAGCWGKGNEMCQQLTLEHCSPECEDARCRGTTRDDCCDSECAVGCSGPTARDCTICLHVNNSGSCEFACPPEFIYDPQTQRNIPNPKFKYHYDDRCVNKCPSNLLIEDNGCVKSCRVGFHNNGEGKCVPCKEEVCDKECYGVGHADGPLVHFKTVDSSNVHYFKGCNIVKGNVVFQSFAFAGDTHTKLPPMNVSQMAAFKDVKTITGYLHIVAWPKELANFSVFKNLQIIGGVGLYHDIVALIIQDNTHPAGPFYLDQITSLGFESLRAINHGNVYIGYCQNLCYEQLVNWTSIIRHHTEYRGFNNGLLLRKNGESTECNTTTCDPECDSNGCWGPGPDQCLKCSHYTYFGRTCMESCPVELGIYANHTDFQCKPCHDLCNGTCYGEGPGKCFGCKYASYNGICLEECPSDMYNTHNSTECQKCHPNCVSHRGERFCTGPGNTVGKNACNYCDFATTTAGGLDILQCLPPGSRCPNAHFSHDGSIKSATHTCVPCIEGCTNCTGSRREDCRHALRSQNDTVVAAVVIPVVLVVLSVLVGIVLCCRYRRRQNIKKRQHSMRALGIDPCAEESQMDARARLMEPMTPSGVAPNQAQLRIVKDAELRIGKILGSGAFGTVHKGYWIPDLAPRERVKVPVAIKVLRDESSQVASNEILDEAFVMASCEHPNLVRLLGISLSQRIMLITQLMPLGNLLEYVRENKDNIGSQHLLNWSLQIAKGMRYLAEEKHLVHRDLAARNVLVKSPNHVRITDFGLAKLLDVNEDVYRAEGGKMPIKWLALESIQHRIFTQKSDVWGFGVTMWELMTFGKKPYENVPAREVHTLLEKGERLPQPYICTIDIYMLLIKCWTVDAEARPTFRELSEDLSKMARDPQRYVVIDNEGHLTELPSPTTSEFLRSLMNEEGDDFPITDAEEYLHPQALTGAEDGAWNDNPFALQPCPSVVPWKRQHQQQLSSTSSQQALLEARGGGSGRFRGRMDSGRLAQNSRNADRRLDSVMTTMTNLSSISGSQPNGASTPFTSVTMPISPDMTCDDEVVLSVAGGAMTGQKEGLPNQAVLGVINNARTFSESSDVFGPPSSKRPDDNPQGWPGNHCPDQAQRLTRAREDSTTMRYSAEPVSLLRQQQTKPNENKTKVQPKPAIEFSKDEDGYLTPFEAANKRPEYLDPSEFPPSPFATKPPVNILDLPTSSLSNPEYEPAFVPSDPGVHLDEEGYEIPISSGVAPEYQNLDQEENLKLDPAFSLRHPSQSGDSVGSEKRDSGMQSDEDGEKKTTAVANPNYDFLENANSDAGLLGQEHEQPEYVNTSAPAEKGAFPDDDIFSLMQKNHKHLPNSKEGIGRTYSEPDSGVGIEVAVDNMLYHKLGAAWDNSE
ncbi:epidermal growth factor receptor-like isoform X1 [Clavelina lepadiformis]|uniref:epidermal growth factor receptor-like isoform X1 n=1 Tax=Clavelina lepadiformis TaxID=159417 RepID=UPI0040429B0A